MGLRESNSSDGLLILFRGGTAAHFPRTAIVALPPLLQLFAIRSLPRPGGISLRRQLLLSLRQLLLSLRQLLPSLRQLELHCRAEDGRRRRWLRDDRCRRWLIDDVCRHRRRATRAVGRSIGLIVLGVFGMRRTNVAANAATVVVPHAAHVPAPLRARLTPVRVLA